jgi:hypothetical protein
MVSVQGPDFIIAGTQKTGTTWLFDCLQEHPDILMPKKGNNRPDSLNYFDGMNYHRGESWYLSHFEHYNGEHLVGEETPSYIRSLSAPKRIAQTYPDVDLLFCVRNPIDRAFSHYWHLKSRNKISVDFEACLNSPDFYQDWVVPGFYNHHIQRYLEYFNKKQIYILFFDDLVQDDHAYIKNVYKLLDVDDSFAPSRLDEKENQAWASGSLYRKAAYHFSKNAPQTLIETIRPIHELYQRVLLSQSEYNEGPPLDVHQELAKIYESDVSNFSEYTDRDLNHWLTHNPSK